MSAKRMVRRTLSSKRPGRTDWSRVDEQTDQRIEAAIQQDPDAAPELGAAFWAAAEVVMPPDAPKEAVTMRLDADVLRFFRDEGRGYQTRINAVLRAYVKAARGGR